MTRLVERIFDSSAPLVVRRFFVAAGRHWEPGDVFDWRRLSVAHRRVRQLFDAGKLMHMSDGGEVFGPGDIPLMGEKPSEQTRLVSDLQPNTPVNTDAQGAAAPLPPADEPEDDLDDLDMRQLRAIAEEIGAPTRVSRAAQREAIREIRHERQN